MYLGSNNRRAQKGVVAWDPDLIHHDEQVGTSVKTEQSSIVWYVAARHCEGMRQA